MRSTIVVATVLAAAGSVVAQSSSSSASTTMASIVNLPLGGSNSDMVASVITAGPSGTVYAIGCANQTNTAQLCGAAAGCYLESSITVTQNESTVHYTWTDDAAQIAMAASTTSSVHTSGGGSWSTASAAAPSGSVTDIYPDIRTVGCAIYGGSTITSAVCTGQSSVPGVGNKTESITLGTKDLSRVAVAVTAGATSTSSSSSSSSASTTSSASGSKTSGAAGAAGASSSTSQAGAAAPLATVAGYAGAVLVGVAGVVML